MSYPPFIEALSEMFIEPFKMITTLEDLEILDQNPKFLKLSMPNILVLSEESAGNGVIEGLFGISIPGFQIPIILKFESSCVLACQKIWFQYHVEDMYSEREETSETCLFQQISQWLNTVEEAKKSQVEVVLTVRGPLPFDFTVVILPEINKYNRATTVEMRVLEGYVRKFTKDTKCVIVNVLGCSIHHVDKCLSRTILKEADLYGLTVFTKLDLSSQSLVTKLTSTSMGTGAPFGFFYVEHDTITVRDEKSFRKVSAFLAGIDKRFVGYQAISKNLVLGIVSLLFSPSSQIVTKLMSDLSSSKIELRRCQNKFESTSKAIAAIISFVSSASTSFNKLILKDYTEYRKETELHVACKLEDRFQMLNASLKEFKVNTEEPFLIREIAILQSGNWSDLSDFVYSSDAKPLLEDQFSFTDLALESFVTKLMQYLEMVVVRLLLDKAIDHVPLHRSLKRIARELICEVKKAFQIKIQEHIDLEKNLVYTSNPEFATQVKEMENVKLNLQQGQDLVNVDAIGNNLKVGHLSCYKSNQIETAFGIKKFMMVYFDYVINRLVDCLSLHLQHIVTHMWAPIVEKVMKEFMELEQLEEEPTLVARRLNLENRVALLSKIKSVIMMLQS